VDLFIESQRAGARHRHPLRGRVRPRLCPASGGSAPPSNQSKTSQQPANPAPNSQRPPQQGRADQFVGWEWWKDDAVKKDLALTDSQARSITRLYEDRARQMKTHSDEFQKQLEELDKMTRERTVDVATYSIQVTRVEALRTELSKTRTVMLYSIYRMLTPEQYQKLRQIRDQRRSGRGGGGTR
jgi:Spy/CpxP family protein refolding chaperone